MLFERSESRMALAECRILVASLKPGQRVRLARSTLKLIDENFHNGASFSPADRILGGIMGSGYSLWYELDPMTQDVVFGRVEPLTDGRRTYVDPDYRHQYERSGLFWRPRPQPKAEADTAPSSHG